MPVAPPGSGELHTFDASSLDTLISILRGQGFTVVGPVFRDGAVVLDEIDGAADLPAGVTDEQDAGRYRATKGAAGRLFDFANGPESWKRRLHPPALRLWKGARHGKGFVAGPVDEPPPKLALFGARACDLAAIAVQDRVFLGGRYTDPAYRTRREEAFVVAVACTRAGGTCFCASTGTGPAPSGGFDLALTPIGENGTRAFVVACGTSRG
ncbi:MAG TPA: sulfite reductase subunit A, partial [Thermoanaerobaculia bacterium]|nr:sulfite reductase subunit A [Thermoanaerobaculia bacterium]